MEKIIEKDGKKTIENDSYWSTISTIRWKYIAEVIASMIIAMAIFTYSYMGKSLPKWFQIITIMASFWVFFPDLYESYIKEK